MPDEWNEVMDDQLEAAEQAVGQQLQAERYERAISALYSAAMLGLPEDDLRTLCFETGIAYADLEAWTPPLLRPVSTDAPLPF